MIDRQLPAVRGRWRGDRTVAEIAQLAGVSQPTVSKVLNGRSGVGESTRRRVETLLREHGYRRPSGPPGTAGIEVLMSGMLGSIAIEVVRGIEDVAATRDLTVSLTDIRRRAAAGQSWIEPLLLRRPVGVVAAFAGFTTEHLELLDASGIPVVTLDPVVDQHRTPSVGCNNWSGALAATRHLLDLGHHRIAVITGPVKDLASRARFDGFRAALDAAEVPYDETLRRSGVFTFEDGRDLALEVLSHPDRPTAVVCGDDLQALGVYEAARLRDLRIPGDLSVVGFDDIEHCSWAGPPMTTVRQPFAELGAAAARLVLSLAAGDKPSAHRVELAATLVVRASTAPPAAS
ncbi:LacI family DNA-binding transcriptional regulator [Dactylosporangium matsuzakiense]|uniref:Transcriptional regulator n=1 Tax=Dactylosporangium matsuzakiense TaxID=53360 RepID=A0A9W6KSM0_9ACTN|nr:LacI family DNA-binding transcriptional regulator [Dactylosporangium matsuzakiense]UWZ42855.1 LacI family DNA-binding transcriptional regulator [Dactylosporangium matsuzakiense]GLL07337.1 transcriptional regulator [Dactylosporangium matsuzakiense]